jgi:hypothetical protein
MSESTHIFPVPFNSKLSDRPRSLAKAAIIPGLPLFEGQAKCNTVTLAHSYNTWPFVRKSD